MKSLLEDLENEREERLKPILYKHLEVDDDYLTITTAYEYNIEKSRIKSAGDVLEWVCHLERKTWVTPEVLGEFVTACLYFVEWEGTL